MSKIFIASLTGLLIGMACLFVYFYRTTPSDNTVSTAGPSADVCFEPRGDAVYYSIMAARFDDPGHVTTPFTSIHARRLLAPLLVHLLSRAELQRYKAELGAFEFEYDRKGTFTNATILAVYRIVEKNFLWLNLGAYLCASFFLFLVLNASGSRPPVSALLVLMLSSLPVYMRIYFGWPVMIDPLYILFVAIFFLFMMQDRFLPAALIIALGALASEKMLLLLLVLTPYYLVRTRRRGAAAGCTALAYVLIPLLTYLFCALNPVFGNVKPFTDVGETRVGSAFDYYGLLVFHVRRYLVEDRAWLKQILVYFNCFGGFLYLLILYHRDAAAYLRSNLYWLPFLVVTLCYSFFVDRYVITLFPFVLLCTAYIIRTRFSDFTAPTILFAATIVLAHLVATRFFYSGLNDHGSYRYYTFGHFNLFTTKLQVEYQDGKWLTRTLYLHTCCFLATAAAWYVRGLWARGKDGLKETVSG